MKNFLNYPLEIQFFAEGDPEPGVPTPSAQQTTPQINIDYEKLADVVNKRSASSSDSAIRGYLKEQGLTGDELNAAVNQYKQSQKQKADDESQRVGNLETENARLKAEIQNSKIESKLNELASKEGIQAEKLPFLIKLVDRKDFVNDKGDVDETKVKESIDAVLKAFPDFKATQSGSGFQQIGGNGSGGTTNPVDAQLDAIFGVKK